MTESDIYQLVGKAYCDGLNQGIEKSASANVLRSAGKLMGQAINQGAFKGLGTEAGRALYDQAKSLAQTASGFKAGNILRLLGNKTGAAQDKWISRISNILGRKSYTYSPEAVTNILKDSLNPDSGIFSQFSKNSLVDAIRNRALH